VLSDSLAKWLLYSQIIAATFLQKIAIPLGQHTQVFLALVIMLGAAGIGIVSQRMEIRTTRLALYLLMAGGVTLIQLLRASEFSATSLLLLLVIHLPYAVGLKNGITCTEDALAFFRKIMVIIALVGLAQFALQFIIGRQYAFFLDTLFPQEWIASGFNQLIPTHYNSALCKSNGFFMLEPSIFSQFLALSLIIEMVCFKNPKVIALYLAALLTTFSGTGLVILAAVVPAYLLFQRKYTLLAGVGVAFIAFLWIAPYVGLADYAGRVNEFTKTTTSGYARFLSIFSTIRDFVLPHTDTLLLGLGAGSFRDVGQHVSYAWHAPTWGKIFVEYGLIGALVYFPLLMYVFFTSQQSPYIKVALGIQFLFLAEYALNPTVHNLLLALLAWPVASISKQSQENVLPG